MAEFDEEDFGSGDEPEMGIVVPFPGMRVNDRLAEAWAKEVARRNQANRTSYIFPSPAQIVDTIMRKRTLPVLGWPASWPRLAARARLYAGDAMSIAGPKGGGKTSFAIQIARANMGDGIPVIWVGLDLDDSQITVRVIANQHGVHTKEIREHWPRQRIDHAIASFADLWHFADRHIDVDRQIASIMDVVSITKAIYRRPPVVVVDYLGKLTALAAMSAEVRRSTIQVVSQLQQLCLHEEFFLILLVQTSRANEMKLVGREDFDSATDAMGMASDASAVEAECRVQLALAVFKADDAPRLDSHVLCSKSNVGLEGREGFSFAKAGGVWGELDYLPATPSQVKAEADKDKRDKHRAGPARSPVEVRSDINAAKAGDAAALRRAAILAAIRRHGMLGMELRAVRQIHGAGRGPAVVQALNELEATQLIERVGHNKWRAILGQT